MASISHESASGSTGVAGVLAALNNTRVREKETPEVDFLSILRGNSSGVEKGDSTRASVHNEVREAGRPSESQETVRTRTQVHEHLAEERSEQAVQEPADNMDPVNDVVTDTEQAAAEDVDEPVEGEVLEIAETDQDSESDVDLLVDQVIDEADVADMLSADTVEDMEDLVPADAEIAAENVVAEATDTVAADMGEEVVLDEVGLVPSIEANPESAGESVSEEPVPAVDLEQSISDSTGTVENQSLEVATDVPTSETHVQPTDTATESTAEVVTAPNENADAAAVQAEGEGVTDEEVEPRESERAKHGLQVAQENIGKNVEKPNSRAEVAAPTTQGEAAVAAQIAAREERVENDGGDTNRAIDQNNPIATSQVGSDPSELRREMARIRMHTGVGEVEQRVVQGEGETATDAVAGTFRSQAPEAAEAKDGVAETGRQTMNTTRFVEDIISQARMLSKPDGSTEMRLRLDPPELGSVLMRLTLNNNKLDVQLEVDSPAVRQMVGDTLQRVREILSDDGVDLESFNIGLRRQPNQGAGENGRQGSPRRGGDDDSDATDESQVITPRADALRRAMLSAAGMIDFTA